MPKFNKKQRDYLDKVVKESSTRMILSERLFSVHSTVEDDVMKLGKVWENQWSDLDRYVSDKFIEIHGAKMQQYY
jgi:hypothetical protein